MKKKVFILTMICIAQLTLWNCTRTEDLPTVTTNEVTDITQTTAVAGGSILANGANVTVRGVCYSASNSNPTVDDLHTTDGSGTGDFSSPLSSLLENTTYYVRAYAINGSGVAYGEQVSFRTLPSNPEPEPTPTERLCLPGGWKLAAATSSPAYEVGNMIVENLFDGFIHEWEADDIIVFNPDGTHYVKPGSLMNPNGYTTVTNLGQWYFDNADNPELLYMQVPFFYDAPIETCGIVSLSESELKIRYFYMPEGKKQYSFYLTYVPAE